MSKSNATVKTGKIQGPVFKILSDEAIKAFKDSDGKRRFEIIASSDATDLVGDVFSKKALSKMQSTAKNMTMFLNHSTNVPDDVFGCVEEAIIEQKKIPNRITGNMENCYVLTYKGIVTEVNPQAVKTHEMMVEGVVKLGASVTVGILEKSRLDDGRRQLDDVLNIECSIVGVPCNPTSWVVNAQKSLQTDELPDQTVSDGDNLVQEFKEKFQKIFKGYFVEELNETQNNIWFLVDVLVASFREIQWDLNYRKTITHDDLKEAINTMIDEFSSVAKERLYNSFSTEDDDFDSYSLFDKAEFVKIIKSDESFSDLFVQKGDPEISEKLLKLQEAIDELETSKKTLLADAESHKTTAQKWKQVATTSAKLLEKLGKVPA